MNGIFVLPSSTRIQFQKISTYQACFCIKIWANIVAGNRFIQLCLSCQVFFCILIPRISKHPPPVQQSLIHRLLLPFQKHLQLKYNRRQNISSDNPQEKNKHREWNLHYKKNTWHERHIWMHLFPATMFARIVILNNTWYVEIFRNWIQELKTEERIFRYIQDLVEL